MPGASMSDLSVFFAEDEFATLASWRPQTGPDVEIAALWDQETDLLLDNTSRIDGILTYPTAAWPGAREQDEVRIGCGVYVMRQVRRIDDGALSRAWLMKVDR